MAKPIAGEPGSAMHVHQSVVNKATGKNIFSNEDGTPSQEFFWYIGGLQKYIPAAMALFAPYVNSLPPAGALERRADQHPVGHRQPHRGHPLAGGRRRRRGASRTASSAPTPTRTWRWPPRWPAATWASRTASSPRAECKGDAYLGDIQLPRSLGEALQLLRDEKDLAEVLGEPFVTVYTEVKEIEYAEFMKVISPWEREHLLLHV